MKKKIISGIVSIFVTLIITEITLRFLNLPPELNKDFQRKDLSWTEKNVVLNSAGYRDKEYPLERAENVSRIFALGDSYTYGWLVDNPEDSYPKKIEKKISASGKNVEVINAGSPGFSTQEMVKRFILEGKYYNPDLVIIGINDDEANFTKTYIAPYDNKLNKFIKSLHLYQISLGNYFKHQAEKINHDYVLKIYTDHNSKEWEKFSEQILVLKKETERINSKLAIILFPHIHPNRPKDSYDYYPFNKKFKQFGEENEIFIIDPLEDFLKYQEKSDLVINPLDPHPTAKMNEIVANAFLEQFNIENYLALKKPFVLQTKKVTVDKNYLEIGKFDLIKNISSNIPDLPWVYFETKYETASQDFPLKDISFRNTKIYVDILKTAKSFTHSGLPGATISYHIYPKEKGRIVFPKEIYGYEVIGVNHILALSILNDGTIVSDYLNPQKIEFSGDNVKINFNPEKNYHVYRLNLNIALKQIDLSSDGKIENIIKTYPLKTLLKEDLNQIVFNFDKKISSWQEFSPEQGVNNSVAFIDGVMTKIEAIDIKDNEVKLRFQKTLKKGQQVEFYVSALYELEENETIDFQILEPG